MYIIELTLKGNPLGLSVQRKDKESAEALYQSIVEAMKPNSGHGILELTCDKQEDKKIAVMTSEISAIQISEKTGGSQTTGVGFSR